MLPDQFLSLKSTLGPFSAWIKWHFFIRHVVEWRMNHRKASGPKTIMKFCHYPTLVIAFGSRVFVHEHEQ